MLFSITLIDRPDSAKLRAANAAAHRAYVTEFFASILLGGPLMAADGTTMIGSQIVIELADPSALRAFIDNEPYNRAGLFEQVLKRRFAPVIANPELFEGTTS